MNNIQYQITSSMVRNLFIALSRIIPIVTGMGINFAITIGAMAAQVGMLLAINWSLTGMSGILVAALITVPLASLFGFLIGSLLNKMKGQETIGSLILGYFANGAYQLLFLFVFGLIIPLSAKVTIVGATGVRNTLDLTINGLQGSLDNVLKIHFGLALYIVSGFIALMALILLLTGKMSRKRGIALIVLPAVLSALYSLPFVYPYFGNVYVPVVTFLLVGLLCLFNAGIMKTRLGQQFRAVGQNRTVANAAGINVNRVRLIAIMISTVFAGWGQIIFIQNLGTLQTYSAHEMVGLYAGAAILVGGASIDRATNAQAIIGCLLFHTLFVVAQDAGTVLFGDPVVGEYFRVFLCYGVIAVALVMYAWRGVKKAMKPSAQAAIPTGKV
ncbi:MAG: ABC transporter permease [Clostridiales bacterium]|nr:ABC transporter permease [Clostridiales bacterium]